MPLARLPESRVASSLLLLAGAVLVLIFAKVLLVPLAFALTLSFVLVPGVSRLEKKGVPRIISVGIACCLLCAALLGGAYVLSNQILNVAETLPSYRANIQKKIESLHSKTEVSLEAAADLIEDMSGDLANTKLSSPEKVTPVRVVGERSDQLRSTAELLMRTLQPIGELGVVVIFTIYMLLHREELRHRLLLLAGMGNLNVMTHALQDATDRISQYLVMQFQINACYGVLFGTGLFFLHIPEATLWGVIAGALRIVPFVGTLMGMAFPLILSIAVSSSWWPPMLVAALFFTLEMLTANVVEPWLFSERTGISSLALLASAIFWSMLWGWPGLVLSTPLTVCLVVVGRHVPQFAFLNSLLGTTAKLSPAAHMYERLLALDQVEASSIAERYLKGRPLVKLYDSVVIPVLSLAEEDRHKGALDDIRSKFVLLSLGELVAKMTSYVQEGPPAEPKSERALLIEKMHVRVSKEFAIVCLSANDQADDLTTSMLTQLLERDGHQTLKLSAEALSEEILAGLATETQTVVFISALPPFAFAQARALCIKLRSHLPKNRIAVALWNSPEDGEEIIGRFGNARPDAVVATLKQALQQVEAWRR
ncbi:AI-2E family transporter [Granulicella sibirica]|nr:AI-2E family transporter [Granulicella sibirica]